MNNIQNDQVNISQLKRLLGPSSVTTPDDGLFIADIESDSRNFPIFQHPTKFNGFLGIFCVSGHLKVSVNLREFNVRRNSFTVVTPGSIVMAVNNEPGIVCHVRLVSMSSEYMTKLRFDLSRLFAGSFSPIAHPSIVFNKSELVLAMRYYSLMKFVIGANRPYMKESILALCSSLIYEIAGSWKKRVSNIGQIDENSNRANEIYEKFMGLVSRYHLEHRTVNFYADKLYISTKYLARVVKQASGHTASYWIDSYVILEAKNLLRYSDITIKEIAFRLNFTNQSVFHKYFKAHTGLTPLEYRNS